LGLAAPTGQDRDREDKRFISWKSKSARILRKDHGR
jgi:hypothetical protein